jgi:large subunit ribosomal protein L15
MQLHLLQSSAPRTRKKRVGRGGKRGKTSGRGTKGQKARAGHKMRPELRDIIKKLPKRRGYGKNRARGVHSGRVRPVVVNLGMLASASALEGVINPRALVSAGLIRMQAGSVPHVKILGDGTVEKKLSVTGCSFSVSAKEKIEHAGGTIA